MLAGREAIAPDTYRAACAMTDGDTFFVAVIRRAVAMAVIDVGRSTSHRRINRYLMTADLGELIETARSRCFARVARERHPAEQNG